MFGFRCTGYATSRSGCRSTRVLTARQISRMGSPKFSRRCAVNRTRREARRTNGAPARGRAAIHFTASTTVFPVRKTAPSASARSRRRFSAARVVGAKWSSATWLTMRRMSSSGNGLVRTPVRRPASTCPTGVRRKNAARLEAIAVVVSPCTTTTSGRSSSMTRATARMAAAATSSDR